MRDHPVYESGDGFYQVLLFQVQVRIGVGHFHTRSAASSWYMWAS